MLGKRQSAVSSGMSSLRTWVGQLWSGRTPQGIVLLYHSVRDASSDPQLLSVTPHRFASHMACLASRYRVVSLHDLVEGVSQGQHQDEKLVAVTFDDGYEDNLIYARPVLEQYRVPATVFVATGLMGDNQEFWWDELERIFIQPSTLPQTCRVLLEEAMYERDLGSAASYGEDEFARHRRWSVMDRSNPTARHAIYRELCMLMRPMTPRTRVHVLEAIRAWSGMGGSGRPAYRCLTPSQVKELGAGSLVDIGAHSVSHAVLSKLSLDEQRKEICESRDQLEQIVGRRVTAFAYPYGTYADYGRETAGLLREAGFAVGCSNFPGVIRRRHDVFQLPRFIVRDWDQDTFAENIDCWFAGKVEMTSHGS